MSELDNLSPVYADGSFGNATEIIPKMNLLRKTRYLYRNVGWNDLIIC